MPVGYARAGGQESCRALAHRRPMAVKVICIHVHRVNTEDLQHLEGLLRQKL